jgi:uncharacterized protein with PQ loop repeat
MGIIATILILFGLLPPYLSIFREKGRVVGISFTFLAIDMLGALLSMVALAIQHTFDVGGVLYVGA